jgi:hypothetical protein
LCANLANASLAIFKNQILVLLQFKFGKFGKILLLALAKLGKFDVILVSLSSLVTLVRYNNKRHIICVLDIKRPNFAKLAFNYFNFPPNSPMHQNSPNLPNVPKLAQVIWQIWQILCLTLIQISNKCELYLTFSREGV